MSKPPTAAAIAGHAQARVPAGVAVQLCRGRGYYYFTAERYDAAGVCDFFHTVSVYTVALCHMPAGRWMAAAESAAEEITRELEDRDDCKAVRRAG